MLAPQTMVPGNAACSCLAFVLRCLAVVLERRTPALEEVNPHQWLERCCCGSKAGARDAPSTRKCEQMALALSGSVRAIPQLQLLSAGMVPHAKGRRSYVKWMLCSFTCPNPGVKEREKGVFSPGPPPD